MPLAAHKLLLSCPLSSGVKHCWKKSPVHSKVKLLALTQLHGNFGLLMNTTYSLWFECFQSTERIQKASLPAPAACLYTSQWFTPTQLLYLINKRLAIAANFAVLTLERPRQALAGYQLWQQETAPRQHWENSSCKSQKQKRTGRARCFQAALFSIWAVCAAEQCQGRGGEEKEKKGLIRRLI